MTHYIFDNVKVPIKSILYCARVVEDARGLAKLEYALAPVLCWIVLYSCYLPSFNIYKKTLHQFKAKFILLKYLKVEI